MMESYTDLDLHLQFICFFRNERLCIDSSNDQRYILPTSKLTEYYQTTCYQLTINLLNTINGVNCIQSVFPYSKLQQPEVTKKRLLTLNNIETNKINKKRKISHMLHIDQNFKCEYSSSNLNFIVSFQYREIYVAVFTTPFEWNNSTFSRVCRSHAILTSCRSHADG